MCAGVNSNGGGMKSLDWLRSFEVFVGSQRRCAKWRRLWGGL